MRKVRRARGTEPVCDIPECFGRAWAFFISKDFPIILGYGSFCEEHAAPYRGILTNWVEVHETLLEALLRNWEDPAASDECIVCGDSSSKFFIPFSTPATGWGGYGSVNPLVTCAACASTVSPKGWHEVDQEEFILHEIMTA